MQVPAVVADGDGRPVRVTARGGVSAAPATIALDVSMVPPAETAYSTPRPPSRAAYSSMPALGAKLGDSSRLPVDTVLQRGDPRLESMIAIR